ncbi:OprO/OprP family phosphate-selective porin [Oleiharenicola lentus]|uniref:OprO/OprP family phosphate-selective porin n=1 Tax=Oleiharenicola lentus TaxID=2508720 RepID=UPI003F66FABA
MIIRNTAARAVLSAGLLLATLPVVGSAQSDDIQFLREQIRLLDQKLRVLERKQELKDEASATAAAAAAKSTPKITASDGRFEIVSADGAHSLRLRGLIQGDYRWYDAANDPNDTFILRRTRLIFEGKFNNIFQYYIQPEFGGTIQILDANINAAFSPAFNVRVGKFKTPVGLEQLQSDPVAFFNERSIATNLTPNRDLGLQIQGDVLDNRLNYTVAVLNGVPDGGNNVTGSADFDADKTLAARLFATPFANDKESALAGLGVGVAVSAGDYATVNGRTAAYRTDGQQNFFTYETNVSAAGKGLTFSPQAYYYRGPLGVLAEYVGSSIEVQRGTDPIQKVKNFGYNLTVGYVLTGEDSTYRGVSPKNSFNPKAGTWGAFELVARVSNLDVDDSAFNGAAAARLANPNVSATELNAFGLGLNWHLSKSVRAGFNFYHNEFKLAPGAVPAANALINDDENTVITRLQVSF